MPNRNRQAVVPYVVAIAGAALAVGVRYFFHSFLSGEGSYLPFILAVVVAAWCGGLWPGIVATLFGALGKAFLIAPLVEPALLREPAGVLKFGLFLVVSVAVSWLFELLHVSRRRLLAERARQATSDTYHHAIADLSSDFAFHGVVERDGTVRLDDLTGGFSRVLGYTPEEYRGFKRWILLVHQEDRPLMEGVVRRLVRGEESEGEFRAVAKDGSAVWMHFKVSPERGPRGDVVGVFGAARDVTQQRLAEESRRASEERERAKAQQLAAILDGIPAIIVIAHDRHGRHITVSRYGGAVLGWPEHANVATMLTADGRANGLRVRQNGVEVRAEDLPLQRACRGIEVRDVELEFQLPDGSRRSVIGNAIPLRGQDGTVQGAVGAFVDVTDRHHAEAELQSSRARLEQALDAGSMGAWEWDIASGAVEWPDNLSKLFGLSPGEFGGTLSDFERLVHPDDREQVKQALEESLRTGERFNLQFRICRPDGTVRWMAGMGTPLYDENGQPVRMVGIGMDVTERRLAEETINALLSVGTRVSSTLDVDALLDILVQEAMSLADAESGLAGLFTTESMTSHRYVWRGAPVPFEHTWQPMQGLAGWVMVQKVPYLTNHAAGDSQVDPEMRARFRVRSAVAVPILSSEGDVLGFFEVHNKQGESGFTETDRDRLAAISRPAAVALQNAMAYRRLQEAQEALQVADARKEEFLATLAHELRNPLAPIRNAVEILNLKSPPMPELRMARDVIVRQVAQMVRLVDDLLDVSRVSRGALQIRREQVELVSVLQNALETSRPMIDASRHHLTISVPREPIYVDADPTRLAQVVSNLMNNAAKYMARGGSIWLTVIRNDGEVVISVRDRGIGIAPEQLPRIFDMFAQVQPALERPEGGLGIGLWLVRSLVELHGGAVEAHSDGPGAGSEFIVRLPVLRAPVPRISAPDGDHEAAAARRHRILVVDDNRDTAESLAEVMRLQGHEVRAGYDGVQAAEICASWLPDVVLLDLGLPKLNGYEAARRIRAQSNGREILLVAVTGWGQEEDRKRSRAAGFDHHLVKPVDPAAFGRLMDAFFAGSVAEEDALRR